MNIKKIVASAAAAAIAVGTMATNAFALNFPYTANMYYASGDWYAQTDTSVCTAEITGDGTYTLTAGWVQVDDPDTGDKIDPTCSGGAMVFVIDIPQLGADLGVSQDEDYDMSKCTFSDLKVVVGGTEITVDESKLLWGDPEDKGNLRLEIYNAYGSTALNQAYDASVSPLNPADIVAWDDSDAETYVTFTISGINEDAADSEPADSEDAADSEPADTDASAGDTDTTTTDKTNSDTGIEGVAAIAGLAIVATGAVLVAKKRK